MSPPESDAQPNGDEAPRVGVTGAGERTELAWERTAIATAAVGVLMLRGAIVQKQLALGIPLAALLAGAAVAQWRFGHRAYVGQSPSARGALHDRALAATVVVIVVATVGALAMAVRP